GPGAVHGKRPLPRNFRKCRRSRSTVAFWSRWQPAPRPRAFSSSPPRSSGTTSEAGRRWRAFWEPTIMGTRLAARSVSAIPRVAWFGRLPTIWWQRSASRMSLSCIAPTRPSSHPKETRPRSESSWRSSRNAGMNASSEPASSDFPAHGRLLGLDYGTKRLGLALSNAEQTIATPLETWLRRDQRQDEKYLQQKVQEYGVVGLVVGLPVHMSGDEGEKAREARVFGEWAATVTK